MVPRLGQIAARPTLDSIASNVDSESDDLVLLLRQKTTNPALNKSCGVTLPVSDDTASFFRRESTSPALNDGAGLVHLEFQNLVLLLGQE